MKPEGLPIGRLQSPPPSLWEGITGLFNPRFPAGEACKRFLRAVRRQPRTDLVRLSRAVHTAVFAPPGTGKSTGLAIPHLLTCTDAMVNVDFKGELYRATAEHRRRVFGHQIVALDPYKLVTEHPDSFNPLDWIDKDARTAVDDIRDLAEALVIRTGQEKDPHWTDSAEEWIGSMIALVVVCGEPEDRSLQTVRDVLTNPAKMEIAIKMLCSSTEWGGMLARMGGKLLQFKDKELGSVMTTTNRMLRFLDTPLVADSTRSSSFDPSQLNRGAMTVYLVLPPEHMRAQSALLRMWIGSMMRAVVKGGLRG